MIRRRLVAFAIALALSSTLSPLGAIGARADTPASLLAQRYEIDATLDVAAGRLDAVLRLELENRSARPVTRVTLASVARALGFFELVGPVRVDGEAVDARWTTSIALDVPLPRLATGDRTRVELSFRLVVARAPDAFTARLSRENDVLSFGHWFPIVSTPHEVHGIGDPQISYTADRIRLDLRTTTALPRDAVACPGLVTSPDPSGTRWACEVERVRDFSFVVNPRFRLTERAIGDRTLRVYTETVDGSATADLATRALTGMEERFGRYPWDDLVLAEVGSGGGFSMEYPRMIHLTRDKVADPYVVLHEVAHQWFYGQLGNDQQSEPWLDEAFADFSARALLGIGENQCSTRPVDSTVFAWPAGATTGGDWTGCDGYFHAVFYQGTEFLTAVQVAMGEAAFLAAMRDWVELHRHGFVTGDRLLRHLERHSSADLAPIFARYLADPDPARPRQPAARGAPAAPSLE